MNETGEAISEKVRGELGHYDLPLFEVGGTEVTVATLIVVGAVVAATLVASWLIQRALVRLLARRGVSDQGEVKALRRILHYAVLFIGLSVGLTTAGINLTALFTAGAVFAVALGFAMQNITENFASGLILLIERSIKHDDVLDLDGRTVRVERMGIRSTVALTLDDERVIIPNTHLVQHTIKNYTYRDRSYRLRTLVGVAYSSDMDQVGAVLREVAAALPFRLSQEPRVLLVDLADSAVVWEVSVWIDDPWRMRQRRSDIYLAIFRALRKAGITIAFPQLDVHLDPAVTAALARRAERTGGDRAEPS